MGTLANEAASDAMDVFHDRMTAQIFGSLPRPGFQAVTTIAGGPASTWRPSTCAARGPRRAATTVRAGSRRVGLPVHGR